MDKASAIMILRIRSTELMQSGRHVWALNAVPDGTSQDDMGPEFTHPMYRPALLLFGLAIEAYVKALLIHQSANTVDLQAAMKEIPSGHNLVQLCSRANIPLDKGETKVMKRLSDSVYWVSKYATPKVVTKRNSQDLARNDQDYYVLQAVYERIGRQLPPPLNPALSY